MVSELEVAGAGVLGFDSNAASRTGTRYESIEWANRTMRLLPERPSTCMQLCTTLIMSTPGTARTGPRSQGRTHIDLDLDRNYDTTHMRMTSTQPSQKQRRV